MCNVFRSALVTYATPFWCNNGTSTSGTTSLTRDACTGWSAATTGRTPAPRWASKGSTPRRCSAWTMSPPQQRARRPPPTACPSPRRAPPPRWLSRSHRLHHPRLNRRLRHLWRPHLTGKDGTLMTQRIIGLRWKRCKSFSTGVQLFSLFLAVAFVWLKYNLPPCDAVRKQKNLV